MEKQPLKFTIAEKPFVPIGSTTPDAETVPQWMYDLKPWMTCRKLSAVATLWWFNLLCACWHLTLAIVTYFMSTSNNRSFNTPALAVYTTRLTWQANQTDALIPRYEKADTPLNLTLLTMAFFLLSFGFHTLIVLLNYKAVGLVCFTFDKRVQGWHNWYYRNIQMCRNPLRWFEYSFSASVMGVTFAVAGGVAHVYMLAMIFVLLFDTMVAGYYCELMSPPEPDMKGRPQKWAIRSDTPHLLQFPEWPWTARLQRLSAHFLGYVPYITFWAVLLHSFFHNAGQAEPGPPGFVYAIIISQAAVFSSFGLTQFLLQVFDGGAYHYIWGEFSYQFLSVLAKGILGIILLANVILYDSFDEAVRVQQMNGGS